MIVALGTILLLIDSDERQERSNQNRAQQKAQQPIQLDSSQDTKEDQDKGHARPRSNQDRLQEIIHQTDDNHAPK